MESNATKNEAIPPFCRYFGLLFAYIFKKNPIKIVGNQIICYFCTLNNSIFITRTMKKQYQCPDLLIVGNVSPIGVISTSGDGLRAKNPGYSADTGGGFSQDEDSYAPAHRSPWDE